MRLAQVHTRFAAPGRTLRRPGIVAAALLVALLATGCNVLGTSSGQAPVNQKITVATVPGPAAAPLEVAVKNGLFRQHGVTVTVRDYKTIKDAYHALEAGQAAILNGDYADVFYQIAGGMGPKLRLIADGYDATSGTMEVLTLPGSGIKTPQDLTGQAVATVPHGLAPFAANVPYNTQTLATESVLQGDGVSPSSVIWKPMAPGNMVNALRNRSVAAIVATEPYILQAESTLGAVELLDSCSGVTASVPLSGYFSTAAYAGRHAAALHAFQAGLYQAQANSAQRGAVQAALKALPGMDAQYATLVDLGQYPTFLSVGQIQRVADLMYGSGMINNTVSVRGLVFG